MATMTQTTVGEILEIVSDYRGENTTNTDADRIRACSRAERDFARRRFWHTHLLRDQSAGTGDGSTKDFTVGSTNYPMRPKGLSEIFVGDTNEGSRHAVVEFQSFKESYNNNNGEKLAYQYYDAANDAWKVHVSPAPADGDDVTYSYFFEPPERTTSTDPIICANPEIIARITAAIIYEGEDELDKRDEQFQLAEQLIDEQIGVDNSPAVGQTIAMTAIENSGKNRGYGTY